MLLTQNIELTRALKELTRSITGYKRTITDLEKRLAESETKATTCNRRHLDDDEESPDLLAQANLKEQLSAYESELEMLRRRDLERESEISRLRDLVRNISDGNLADSVTLSPAMLITGSQRISRRRKISKGRFGIRKPTIARSAMSRRLIGAHRNIR